MKAIGWLILVAFNLVRIALVLAIPLLGVWLASSLIAWFGGPREAAIAGGILLFPILPLLWEARASRRFRARLASRNWYGKPPRRWFSTFTRVVLRTLFVNALFVAALLFWFPKVSFAALATRGDWFLGGRQDRLSQVARSTAFEAASGLEWLHRLANPNPYKKEGDDAPVPTDVRPTAQRGPAPAPAPTPTPEPPAAGPLQNAGADAGVAQEEPDAGNVAPPVEERPENGSWLVGATSWPRETEVHPAVKAMQPSDEASIEAVARTIAAHESDPFERIKALHDWVVTRLHYDVEALKSRKFPPQDAQSVFTARTGVCEGYARLMVALGKHTGDRIVFVVGDVRKENGEAESEGHAWNAVEIKGAWYLLDATWDDPVTPDRSDVYQTDYLFIPPQLAILDHFPEQGRWQLLEKPLSRGEFLRQPLARPGLARQGLALLAPERSSVEVADALEVELDNPRRLHVLADLVRESENEGPTCGVDDGRRVKLRCTVPEPGKYQMRLYTNRERNGQFGSVATIEVTRR